jgi:putative ABC transport system permease protein
VTEGSLAPTRVSWTALAGLAWRNVARHRRRSAMAVAAVAFGIAALMLSSGFIEWIYFDMREATIHGQLGHVQIVRPGYFENGTADPRRFLLPDQIPSVVRAVDGVRDVAPRLAFSGLVSLGETTLSFVGEGVDPLRERELSRAVRIDAGSALGQANERAVLLGAGLARNLGAKVGDRVVLLSRKGSGGVNAVEVGVKGVFSTVSKAYDDSALRLPIDTARALTGLRGAQSWVVLLDDTARTDRAAQALRKALPADRYEVVPWLQLADFYRKTVALFSRQVGVVTAIIGAIIVLSISNIMVMSVVERTGEIGTSLALGATRRRILREFVLEGMLLGLLGGLIGVALGVALAAIVSAIGIPMPPPPGMAHGFIGQIRITPVLTAQAFLLAAVTALAASFYPAWKASRLPVVDALRHNR